MDAIAQMIQKLEEHLKEAKKIHDALQVLKETTGATFEIPTITLDGAEPLPSSGYLGNIRPDQFFGKSNTEAAEDYLRMLGHSASVDDILAALQKGGMSYTGDARKTLYVSLVRAHKKFVKVGEGKNATFGLKDFYPDLRKKDEEKQETVEADSGAKETESNNEAKKEDSAPPLGEAESNVETGDVGER